MSNKTILIIEDEAAMQKAVSEFLGAQGYFVLSALDGELGLQFAKTKLPDLILLDINLPKKNGIEVLKELKQDATTKLIPVIVLTNLSGMNDIGRVLDAGGTNYLVKSDQDLQGIANIISTTLNGKPA